MIWSWHELYKWLSKPTQSVIFERWLGVCNLRSLRDVLGSCIRRKDMSENLTVKERFLDFSECSYIGEVYAVIKKELELPEWCGENLDALWDAVTGMMYTPANITIKTATKKTALQQSVNDIVTVFHEAEEEYHEITVVVREWYSGSKPNTTTSSSQASYRLRWDFYAPHQNLIPRSFCCSSLPNRLRFAGLAAEDGRWIRGVACIFLSTRDNWHLSELISLRSI